MQLSMGELAMPEHGLPLWFNALKAPGSTIKWHDIDVMKQMHANRTCKG